MFIPILILRETTLFSPPDMHLFRLDREGGTTNRETRKLVYRKTLAVSVHECRKIKWDSRPTRSPHRKSLVRRAVRGSGEQRSSSRDESRIDASDCPRRLNWLAFGLRVPRPTLFATWSKVRIWQCARDFPASLIVRCTPHGTTRARYTARSIVNYYAVTAPSLPPRCGLGRTLS